MMLADTDVLIDFLAGIEPVASRVSGEIGAGLATTAVSRFELRAGARGARQEKAVASLLDALAVLPLDSASADRAAAVRRRLEKGGIGIGMADSLIAGIALVHGAVLLTRNRRHFSRVDGLRLAD
jgi:predicted nucleic acid-binding protein